MKPRIAVVLVGMTVLLVSVHIALAQETGEVGVGISPPRVESDLSARSFEIPILFRNNEDSPRRLELSVSGLGHDLDGTPLFLEPAAATDVIELSEAEFVLEPGQAREIVARGAIPDDERSLYAAVIGLFGPLDVPEGQIESRSRVASILLLRGPRPWEESIRAVDVSILPALNEDEPLRVFAAAENTGNVHVRPSGTIRIVKSGRMLDRVELPAQNIIPGYARRLLGEWQPPRRLTGRVKLVARLVDPDARAVGYVDFTPEGTLAVPGMKIGNLVARDEDGPLIEFVLTNTGTIPLAPEVRIDVTTDGSSVYDTTIEQPRMEAGASEVVQWRPGELTEGVYLVSAEVGFREQLLDRAATGLKLEDKGLPIWVILVGGVLLLLIGLALFKRRRDRRKKDEEQSQETESADAA